MLLRFGDELYIQYWLVNLTIFWNETSTFYGYIRLIEERYHVVVQINVIFFFGQFFVFLYCSTKRSIMQENALQPSANFKKMATKSVLAIVLFVFTYLILVSLAFGLTALCCYIGILLLLTLTGFTIMLGLGLICFGFLILYFLLKFLFTDKSIDRSHLKAITREQQPLIFKLIDEIVLEVKTDFPKNVYISEEVNASVFYNSNFWSMFFPVKKNLHIGIGLMNSVTVDELRAILAHEFGHFSQKSMRVGSFVHVVNNIIYNMLYDNEGYAKVVSNLAQISSFVALFVIIAEKIVLGIQAIQRKVYTIVNLNYLALSREMEFHADAVAAQVAGSRPLITSLLRLQLADYSLNTLYDYYGKKIVENKKAENLFVQHYFVMNYYAEAQRAPFEFGLPQITEEHTKKFNKSKLMLKDQWSSHPTTAERIACLKNLDKPIRNHQEGVAINLLVEKDQVLRQITENVFLRANYSQKPTNIDQNNFEEDFLAEFHQKSFPKVFNEYFDYRNPYVGFNEDSFDVVSEDNSVNFFELFNDGNLEMVYERDGMTYDLQILKQIESGDIKVKSFDYDGQKYNNSDCSNLIRFLQEGVDSLELKLTNLDKSMFENAYVLSVHCGVIDEFKQHYFMYKSVLDKFESHQKVHTAILKTVSFMHTTTPFKIIEQNLIAVKNEEKVFKNQIESLLQDPIYESYFTAEIKERLLKFLNSNYTYFYDKTYFDMQVDELFSAIDDFAFVVSESNFNAKKNLLNFQASLTNNMMVCKEDA